MSVQIQVLTLNCWGITWVSKDVNKRIVAIGRELSSRKYDLVVLQEVWSQKHYEYLRTCTAETLPYSHYFHSGVMGSGVCTFSKGPIVDILMHRYSLNGYAHKIQHGDWFGGKVVGLCRVRYHGLNINVYTTHIHAEYNRGNDEYLTHRISQAFELSQFVRLTGETSDLNILAGDLNLEPDDLGHKIVKENGRLLDAWLERENKLDEDGNTCETPGNSYTIPSALNQNPKGKRIDYILYGNNQGIEIRCLSCITTMAKIPSESFSYSDHEAVLATLLVTKNNLASALEFKVKERREALQDAIPILDRGIINFKHSFLYYCIIFVLALILMISVSHIPIFDYPMLIILLRVFFSIVMAAALWMGLVMTRIEKSGLLSIKKAILVLLNDFNLR